MKTIAVFFFAMIFVCLAIAMRLGVEANYKRIDAAADWRSNLNAREADSLDGTATLFRVGAAICFLVSVPFIALARRREKEVANSKKCPRCAELVKRDALVCRFCQHDFAAADKTRQTAMFSPIEPAQKSCPKCHQSVMKEAVACKHCGHQFVARNIHRAEKAMPKAEFTITEGITEAAAKAWAEVAAEAAKQQALDGAGRYVAKIPGPDTFSLPVVGESHYQTALASICGGYTEEGHDVVVEAHLVLEDSNPHDPDAVRVDIKGETVGYLSRENARQYRIRLIEDGYPHVVAQCVANIRGGWDRGDGDKGYFGVWLDVPTTS